MPSECGDATRASTLKALGISHARMLVLAVNDVEAAKRIAQIAKDIAPHVHVLARAVYIGEVEPLLRAGAKEVVPQELEASVEILARTLLRFLITSDEIGRQIAQVRAEAGAINKLAGVARAEEAGIADLIPGLGVGIHRVGTGACVIGKKLSEVGFRNRTGCTIVAVRRGHQNLPFVAPDTVLQANDAVVVIGPEAQLPLADAMFVAPCHVADNLAMATSGSSHGESLIEKP